MKSESRKFALTDPTYKQNGLSRDDDDLEESQPGNYSWNFPTSPSQGGWPAKKFDDDEEGQDPDDLDEYGETPISGKQGSIPTKTRGDLPYSGVSESDPYTLKGGPLGPNKRSEPQWAFLDDEEPEDLNEAPHIQTFLSDTGVYDVELEQGEKALKRLIAALLRKKVKDKYGSVLHLKNAKHREIFIDQLLKNPQMKAFIDKL